MLFIYRGLPEIEHILYLLPSSPEAAPGSFSSGPSNSDTIAWNAGPMIIVPAFDFFWIGTELVPEELGELAVFR